MGGHDEILEQKPFERSEHSPEEEAALLSFPLPQQPSDHDDLSERRAP
jgi:hypothetical protein